MKNAWSVFNSAGGLEADNATVDEVFNMMTAERMARGWTAVQCFVVKTPEDLSAAMADAQAQADALPHSHVNVDALLQKAYAEGRRDEAEACAKLCEGLWYVDGSATAAEFAAAIRGNARGIVTPSGANPEGMSAEGIEPGPQGAPRSGDAIATKAGGG